VTSTSYSNDGSAGSVTGLSSVTSPSEVAKGGYIGQLYEITALQLAASPLTVNESGTLQLGALQLLDDATLLNVSSSTVNWSVVSGPITGINSNGLATAGTVYQNTAAQVMGAYLGLNGTLTLTVLDTIKDNFGSYAGDGLPDDWQFQYFGSNNPHASPNVVTDGSGLTNLFKYTAGLIPNNAASTFSFSTAPVPGQPGQLSISFSPTFADRSYSVLSSTDLIHWSTLSGPLPGNGGTTTITDSSASAPQKFYRVQITKP
jgi:hypothetical protein